MNDLSTVQEHSPVLGSDGGHVGTVDHVDGNRLKLTKNDSADGQHHFLNAAHIERIDEHVHLKVTADEAKAALTTE